MNNVFYNQPFSEYQAIHAVNATSLKRGLTSMKHMRYAITAPEPPATEAMIWGTMIHTAVLTGMEAFAVWPGRKAGKDYEAFVDAQPNADIISTAQEAKLKMLRESVLSNKHARDIIENSSHEVTLRWFLSNLECKCRCDMVSDSVLADLKSTSKFAPDAFESQAFGLGYHLQMAWYRMGADAVEWSDLPTRVIAVESAPPYDTVVYRCDEEWLERGRDDAMRVFNEYRACLESGVFPGVAEDVRSLALPTWAAEARPRNLEAMEASEL